MNDLFPPPASEADSTGGVPGTQAPPPDEISLTSWQPDGQFRRLHPNYIPAESIGSWIFTAVVTMGLAIGLTLGLILGWLSGWVALLAIGGAALLTALLIWLSLKQPRWEYNHICYAVSDAGVEIHRGIFWRRVINVPRSRVQHTDVTQGPLARRFGIALLQIYTAGTENNQVNLQGLAYEDALRIRNYLVGEVRSDDV